MDKAPIRFDNNCVVITHYRRRGCKARKLILFQYVAMVKQEVIIAYKHTSKKIHEIVHMLDFFIQVDNLTLKLASGCPNQCRGK